MTVLRATIFETLPRTWSHSPSIAAVNNSSKLAPFHQSRKIMASSTSQINASKTIVDMPVTDATASDNPAEYGIETTNINTASGVTLSDSQRLLTGSVLDVSWRSPCVDGCNMADTGLSIAIRRPSLCQEAILVDRRRQIRRSSHQRGRPEAIFGSMVWTGSRLLQD